MEYRTFMPLTPHTKRIFLIRHAHAWHDERPYITMDPELTKIGRKQVEHLHTYFQHVELGLVVTTELQRAQATAEAIRRGRSGVPLYIEPAFNEAHAVGNWRTIDPVTATRLANQRLAKPDDACEGGESLRHIRRRVRNGWEQLLERPETNIAVVMHNGVLSLLISHFFGIGEGDESLVFIRHPHTAVSEVRVLTQNDDEGRPKNNMYIHFLCASQHLPPELLTY